MFIALFPCHVCCPDGVLSLCAGPDLPHIMSYRLKTFPGPEKPRSETSDDQKKKKKLLFRKVEKKYL